MSRLAVHTALLFSLLSFARAGADDAPPPPPPAAPAPAAAAGESQPEIALDLEREIDIASVVTSAAKGVTTVQEAPSIVTIVTADEIKQRGFRSLAHVLASVPGWLYAEAEGNQVVTPLVRGTAQAALALRDGVSMFDPVFNIATFSRAVALESVKRVEVVTGPGGVLWGANSYLGVVNVITKDADDVGGRGVELNVGYGDGPGGPQNVRGYALFGRSFARNRLKVFLHASAETFISPQYTNVPIYAASPAPQPVGPAINGLERLSTAPARSWLVNLDGKISFGPLSLYFNVPFGELNHSLAFSAGLVLNDPEGRNKNFWNFYDRSVALEYKDRFLRDRIGLNAKAYWTQFNRDLNIRLFPDSSGLPKGFQFHTTDLFIQRFGGTIDADYAGPWSWNRLIVGIEVFNERTSNSHIFVDQPEDPRNLPLVCPREADGTSYKRGCPLVFTAGAERTVVGAFIADQLRPLSVLTLDGGFRYQQGFGRRGYDAQLLGSASAVLQFYRDMHLKFNFAQGFRAPVFNNTDSNGAAVQFGGNPNLRPERSDAFQAEANARVLRNTSRIRELQLRVDYAYTVLSDFITIQNSRYANSGNRATHTVEFLGKLYLEGDHTITLGYTFLRGTSNDLGQLRNVPNHWFTLSGVFNVIKDHLDVNGDLQILGSFEDPNRFDTTPFVFGAQPTTIQRYSDVTIDRLTPVAVMQIGARAQLWRDHLAISAQLYNVLNQHYAYPDVFYDQAPTIEVRPTPAPGFSFFASVTYRP